MLFAEILWRCQEWLRPLAKESLDRRSDTLFSSTSSAMSSSFGRAPGAKRREPSRDYRIILQPWCSLALSKTLYPTAVYAHTPASLSLGLVVVRRLVFSVFVYLYLQIRIQTFVCINKKVKSIYILLYIGEWFSNVNFSTQINSIYLYWKVWYTRALSLGNTREIATDLRAYTTVFWFSLFPNG